MNKLKQLASRLRARFAPRQGKSGSSLAFVVTIGAALVIWVMAIMPTMTATGTAAVKLQNSQSDYLDGKSAIEYAKSELLHIVEESVPYTFAVTRGTDADGNTTYDIVEKRDSGSGTTTAYDAIVNSPSTSDLDDVPKNDSVAAICAVQLRSGSVYKYDVLITAYTDCEPGLSYSTEYAAKGNLLIYPESYKQSQALPLSDFVLVDGKLGGIVDASGTRNINFIWNSTIENASDDAYDEFLLAWDISNPDSMSYANAGEYPAVFKQPAQAAVDTTGDLGGDAGGSDVYLDNTLTTGNYIVPQASTSHGVGHIKFENDTVQISDGSAWYPVPVDDYVIYYNGSTTVPTNPGIYSVVIDFAGATYEANGTQYPLLPATGLQVGTYPVDRTTYSAPTISGAGISSVSYSSGTITVTLEKVAGAKYGYYEGTESTTTESTVDIIEWKSSNTFSNLDAKKTYYFYCYIPGGLDQSGNVTPNSAAAYCGMVAPFTAVSELTADEEGNYGDYLILGKSINYNNSTFYAMNVTSETNRGETTYSLGTKKLSDITSNIVDVDTIDSSAVIYGSDFSNLSQYTWTIEKNKSEKYTFYYNYSNYSRYLQLTGSYNSRRWDCSLTTGSNTTNGDFAVQFEGTTATVSRTITSNKQTTTRYLKITNKVEQTDKNSNVNIYFVKVPVDNHPKVNTPDENTSLKTDTYDTITYGEKLNENSKFPADTRYFLNGELTALDAKPAAGVYNVISLKDDVYTSLGVLTVQRAAQDAPSITAKRGVVDDSDITDELIITVTGSGWNNNDGTRYFGYKAEDEREYHWFPADEADPTRKTFRLFYGKYQFAIYEAGTCNFTETDLAESGVKEIVANPITLSAGDMALFRYALDTDPESSTFGTVSWASLPEGLNVNRILGVYFRVPDSDDWSDVYTADARYVGVKIYKATNEDGTIDYSEQVFQITQAAQVTTNNGHMESLISGEALYFMGQASSIHTYGNRIHITADLLVLNNPITGGGIVEVSSYSGTDLLVYFGYDLVNAATGVTVFEKYNFYQIDTYNEVTGQNVPVDLLSVSAAQAEEWKVGDTTDNGSVLEFDSKVTELFHRELYPEINLDIVFASEEQLMHIVSGETIGWTQKGILSGSDSLTQEQLNTNAQYAVCAYVNEIQGAVARSANRVLIAAKTDDGVCALTVPENLSFTTRYLSVDADNIIQGRYGVKFLLNNLGQNQNWLTKIKDLLGLSSYSSKTLQMDYERACYIVTYPNSTSTSTHEEPIKAQICRYDDGTDLFANGANVLPLMVTYTSAEIESMYPSSSSGSATIVDRYITISDLDQDGDGEINVAKDFGGSLSIYTNYLYIDSSIDEIILFDSGWGSFLGSLAGRDCNNIVTINSQESGYTTTEYLNLFKYNSAESYSGTLIYIEQDLTITYGVKGLIFYREENVTLTRGFYFMKASNGGTNVLELTYLGDANSNDDGSVYRITDPETELSKYSVYVTLNGDLSNVYVDTGIYTNTGVGAGGFSGGSVG